MNLGTKREHFRVFLAVWGAFRAFFGSFWGELGTIWVALAFQHAEIIRDEFRFAWKNAFSWAVASCGF